MGIAFYVVGRGRFELPKSETSDLQSDPFGHSGIFPYIKFVICAAGELCSRRLHKALYAEAFPPLAQSLHFVDVRFRRLYKVLCGRGELFPSVCANFCASLRLLALEPAIGIEPTTC